MVLTRLYNQSFFDHLPLGLMVLMTHFPPHLVLN